MALISLYGLRPYPNHYKSLNLVFMSYFGYKAYFSLTTFSGLFPILLQILFFIIFALSVQKFAIQNDEIYIYHKQIKRETTRKNNWKNLAKNTPNSIIFIYSGDEILFTNQEFNNIFMIYPTLFKDTKLLFSQLKSHSNNTDNTGKEHTLLDILTNFNNKSEGKTELGEFVWQTKSQEDSWKYFSASITNTIWKEKNANLVFMYEISENKKVQHEQIAKHYRNLLLTTASHELMTPLNGILGGIQLIEKTEEITDIRQFCEIISASCKFLMNITSSMNDYCLYESGGLVLNAENFNLKSLMEEATKLIEVQTRQRNVSVILKFDNEIPETIISDKKRLMVVFLNILSNAAKYTFKGSITFSAKFNDPLIQIEIADTGIGITESRKNNLFKFFENNNVQLKDRNYIGAGSGLGLTVSQALTKLLGTGISFTTEENVGSKFTFGIFKEISRRRSRSLWGHNRSPRQGAMKRTTFYIPAMKKAKSKITTGTTLMPSPYLRSVLRKQISSPANYDNSTGKLMLFAHRKSSANSDNYSVDDEKEAKSPRKQTSDYNLVMKNSFSSGSVPICDCPDLLVVDDNAFNLLIMKSLLKKLGLTCVTVFFY